MLKACAGPAIRHACVIALLSHTAAASPAVLALGQGVGATWDAADAAAREDLAQRLQRRAAARSDALTGKTAAARREAVSPGRELPLIEVEVVRSSGSGPERRSEARLTDASLAAYQREATRLGNHLRRPEPNATPSDTAARLDQYWRVSAVLDLFTKTRPLDAALADIPWRKSAAKSLPLSAGPQAVAQAVKRDLDRDAIAVSRVVAPTRSDTGAVTMLSASIVDELRAALGVPSNDGRAGYTLDGRYAHVDGKVVLTLTLLDAAFNTRRAFVFALDSASDVGPHPAIRFSGTLHRGLVRIEGPGGATGDGGIDVQVRMGRGDRGLYYRPGERDRLLVKLDRAGHYYVVGHLQKGAVRFSYLMELGPSGTAEQFVRRVSPDQADRWQTATEFTVALPVGVEAIQVIATGRPPQDLLPPTTFDPVRKLHIVGTDPVAAVKRTRGLVRVELPKAAKDAASSTRPRRTAAGEAVLQFSTLP
jgi:hypothetical protein